jgi:flagellar biosynthesis GTPase FlhF
MSENTAPDLSEYSAWQTIGEAATAARVSERTLRKRIKAGEVEAVKTAITGGGVAWRVAPETETAPEAERKNEPEARRKPFERETETERKRAGSESENAPEVSEPRAAPETEAAARGELLAHLQSENAFLRGLVEQRDRDAAELRAALREALKAMPKAIEQGTTVVPSADGGSTPNAQKFAQVRTENDGGENRQKPVIQTSREDATEAPQSGEVAQVGGEVANVRKRHHSREMRPLWKVILGVR